MGSHGGNKKEQTLNPAEAAAMLRQLADQLEKGQVEMDEIAVETSGLVKIKQSVKAKDDKVSFKLKLKAEQIIVPAASEEEPPDEGGDESDPTTLAYKKLKKAMGKQFKAFKKLIETGGAPEASDLEAFAASCDAMITYEDKGDPGYPEFAQATAELRSAAAGGDPQAIAAAVQKLGELKTACHKEYK